MQKYKKLSKIIQNYLLFMFPNTNFIFKKTYLNLIRKHTKYRKRVSIHSKYGYLMVLVN